MNTKNKELLYGVYGDEVPLLKALKVAQRDHIDVYDVFTPFPVHGLDPLLGLSESRLHIAGFIFGMTGTATAFGFMTWAFLRDWPIIFGNKPFWPVPAFIPVTFELTVLFAAIGMVVTFYTVCGMGFGAKNPVLDERSTDDKFLIAFDVTGASNEEVGRLKGFLNGSGAEEVITKTI
jgi:hypothetical protein